MAKKGNRIIIALDCTVCGNQNYTTTKNRINMQEKLELMKFCQNCGKQTLHKELKKKLG